MSLRKLLSAICCAWLAMSASAQQKIFADIELSTHLINSEHTGSDVGESGTLFGIKFVPTIGYCHEQKHELVVGTELVKLFGSKSFMDEAKFLAYYQFNGGRFGVNAGIFQREKLIGNYSRAFYSDAAFIFERSLVQGVSFRYGTDKGFSEITVDWEGMYSKDRREQFRVLFSGGGHFGKYFTAGVSAQLQHFANKSTFEGNVVDNALINPFIECKFHKCLDFKFRAGFMQGLQRDRIMDEGWYTPRGGEIQVRLSKWGVFIDNNTYFGKSLTPFWAREGLDEEEYGEQLYACDPFYGTEHGVYNRTGIGYHNTFCKGALHINAEMVLQYNGKGMYCQQLFSLAAVIAPTIYDKKNHKK